MPMLVLLAVICEDGLKHVIHQFLPDNPSLTENAAVSVDDTGIADISISGTGEDSTVLIKAHAYGTTSFIIKDGDKEYRYNINIYEDDLGTSRIDIISQ